jgi:hypothetical protein
VAHCEVKTISNLDIKLTLCPTGARNKIANKSASSHRHAADGG